MPDEHLTAVFEVFTTKIRKLNEYRNKTDKIFTDRHQIIKETHTRLPEWSIKKESGEFHHFHFRSPSTGEDITLHATPLMLEDLLQLNTLHKLKSYHWLLAEAFEAFEVFVVKAYAYCGFNRISIWQQPEGWAYGDSQNMEHYLKPFKTKDKSSKPYSQLNAFRAGSNHFARYESNGPTSTHYRVIFVLIEKLRHRIVHNGGYCQDLKSLMDEIQAKLPGIDRRSVTPYVEAYFIPHEGSNLIDLLEYESLDDNNKPNGGYHDTMTLFFRVLAEYAQLIMESIQVHPKTKRT